MKKILSSFTALAILSAIPVFTPSFASFDYGFSKPSKQYSSLAERIRKIKLRVKAHQQNTNFSYPRRSTLAPTTPSNNTRYYRPNYSTRSQRSRTRSISPNILTVTMTPRTIRQPIPEISGQSLPIFSIGLRHNTSFGTSDFMPAILVDKIGFQLMDNQGIVADPTRFSLVVNGQDFDFERDGQVALDFNNLRLSAGDSRSIEIAIRANDPDNLPRQRGQFRVKITGVTAYKETNFLSVKTRLHGPSISKFITLDPRPSTSGTPVITSTSPLIHGRTLSAGEDARVLNLKLGASFDDLSVRTLTVRNQYGSDIDGLVSRLKLINNTTGRVIGSTRFTNGKATFTLPYGRADIPRNTKTSLSLEVSIVSQIPSNNSRKLKLLVNPSDIEVWGYGSGREVPNSQKFVTFDTEDFYIAESGATGGITSSSQQPLLFATGTLNNVYQFQITNPGNKTFSVQRMTLEINLNDLAFAGTGNDVALYRSFQGQTQGASLNTQALGGNLFRFDSGREIYIEPHTTQEFTLQLALNRTGPSNNRSIAVKILGDNTSSRGTLSFLQGLGTNFIWSDHSGRPHVSGSFDWLSGRIFPGLPSSVFVNKE